VGIAPAYNHSTCLYDVVPTFPPSYFSTASCAVHNVEHVYLHLCPEDYKGWKLYDPRAQHIVISRDIIWNEEEFPGTSCAVVPHLSVLTEPEEPLPRREDDKEDTPDVVGAEPDPALPPVPPAPPARPIIPKREPEAGPAPQQPPPVTPPGRRDLKSPSSAPRTPPIAKIPLVVPPTPQPAPSQLRRRRAPV
jgi:hypothetical protein